MVSKPAINALSSTGFSDDNFGEQRKLGFEFLPDPDGDVLAGWVFQARDFVQVVVVELLPVRFKKLGDIRVIYYPAEFRVTLAGNNDLRLKTVAVQSAALMRIRQQWQQVGGFKLKCFSELHKKSYDGIS